MIVHLDDKSSDPRSRDGRARKNTKNKKGKKYASSLWRPTSAALGRKHCRAQERPAKKCRCMRGASAIGGLASPSFRAGRGDRWATAPPGRPRLCPRERQTLPSLIPPAHTLSSGANCSPRARSRFAHKRTKTNGGNASRCASPGSTPPWVYRKKKK